MNGNGMTLVKLLQGDKLKIPHIMLIEIINPITSGVPVDKSTLAY